MIRGSSPQIRSANRPPVSSGSRSRSFHGLTSSFHSDDRVMRYCGAGRVRGGSGTTNRSIGISCRIRVAYISGMTCGSVWPLISRIVSTISASRCRVSIDFADGK